ncbi:MAG: hypothetical protein GC185_02830 [Alphaproteobacteria bacterium]|nr:hypothetical protein [Alphaproteobacteria bacterium]
MYNIFSLITLMPLIEIIGFVVIGGKIGLGWTMLWLLADTMLGVKLLKMAGSGAWLRPRPGEDDDLFQVEDAFDSLCLMIAGLLLLFPGFISDFIALPFLLSPVRHWLFGRSKANPDSFMRRFTRDTEGFRTWTYSRTHSERHARGRHETIDAEFRRIDGNDTLNRPRDAQDEADENWPPRP